MNITHHDANRLGEIATEMGALLNEFKSICREAMTPREWELFRYNTLAHLEPGLNTESNWVVGSHVKGLDTIAENAQEDASDEDDEECANCEGAGCRTCEYPSNE